jgi:hypothetical protein
MTQDKQAAADARLFALMEAMHRASRKKVKH